MHPPKAPKVFISHSWDDKKRFVLEFATQLRECGIDAWVDEWEMVAGDSLIRKIFCEGIQNADAFIIILSKNSVSKKWIKEELDLAVIKKIEEGSRVVPIIIDDCEIPEPLKSTVWIKITNLNDYQIEFEKIVMAIFGKSKKPLLGSSPKYTADTIKSFSGLNQIDSIIFNAICETSFELQKICGIRGGQVFNSVKMYDIKDIHFCDSLAFLNHKNFISCEFPVINARIGITHSGMKKYIEEKVPDFNEIEKIVIHKILNLRPNIPSKNINFGDINLLCLHYILKNLSDQNLVKYTMHYGVNRIYIYKLSPVLERLALERFN